LRIQIHKRGIRALGISESFIKGVSDRSILAGVVMRADRVIDGFTFATSTVGGMDSTEKILEMYEWMKRDDINIILLNGCVISWYNVVDLNFLAEKIGLPLICVTYEESEGIERFFKELFPKDWEYRVEIYLKNGVRRKVSVWTGKELYIRFFNIDLEEAVAVLNKFTLSGAVPEPIRVARLLARSLMRRMGKKVILKRNCEKLL